LRDGFHEMRWWLEKALDGATDTDDLVEEPPPIMMTLYT